MFTINIYLYNVYVCLQCILMFTMYNVCLQCIGMLQCIYNI